MKKILVTGAGGFIGSHLTEYLIESGYSVRALVRYQSRGTRGWLEDSKYRSQIEFIFGDVRDLEVVYAAAKGCDTIFHLAALIGIPYSYISPLAYVKTNIEGTYNILQVAREVNAEQVLVTSTSEVYGTAKYVPIDEDHPVNAQSPYAAAKIGADQLALSFFRSFNVPVKIVRPFNTYGPRQSTRAVIPTVITQILDGQRVLHLGNLTPTRDFTFVQDIVSGFIEIAKAQRLVGQITNIGSNQEISIGDLVPMIARLMGTSVEVRGDHKRVRPEGSEVERLLCDNRKIRAQTMWAPVFDLERGLRETIMWFEKSLIDCEADVYNV